MASAALRLLSAKGRIVAVHGPGCACSSPERQLRTAIVASRSIPAPAIAIRRPSQRAACRRGIVPSAPAQVDELLDVHGRGELFRQPERLLLPAAYDVAVFDRYPLQIALITVEVSQPEMRQSQRVVKIQGPAQRLTR